MRSSLSNVSLTNTLSAGGNAWRVEMVALGLVLVAMVAVMYLRSDLATGILLTYRIIVMLGAAILKVALGAALTFLGLRAARSENGLWEVIGALTFLRGWVLIVRSLGTVASIRDGQEFKRDYNGVARDGVAFRHEREALMLHWTA